MRHCLLLIAAGMLLAGCGGAPGPSDRPADDLLSRPDLQRIVELGIARDGAALGVFLNDPDPAVRSRAAFTLASVQDPAALTGLLRLLDDDVLFVRAEAAFAVGQLSDSSAAGALFETVERESSPIVRRRCLEALGKCGGHQALRRLAALVVAPALEPDLALTMARFGMRNIFSEEAIDYLAGALTADDPRLRRNAAYFFGRMANTAIWERVSSQVRGALDRLTVEDPAALYLVQALGRLGAVEDVDRLLAALRSASDWRVRSNAAAALGPLTDTERVRRTLLAACEDPSLHVAVSAARSLAGAAERMTGGEIDILAARVEALNDPWQVAAEWLTLLVGADRADTVRYWRDAQPDDAERARARAERALEPPTRRPPRRPQTPEEAETGPPPVPPLDWDYLAGMGPEPRLELVTDRGRILIILQTSEAPLTVQTILQLADGGFYDGVAFHRVVPNFVVQGGDTGDRDSPGAPADPLRSEFTRLPYERGVIGMASSGKDTEGSQFFITHSMQPHLDGRYTAFGYVVEGMDVVDTLYEGDRIVTARSRAGRSHRH